MFNLEIDDLAKKPYIPQKKILLKPLQNKKGQKILGYPKKSSLFPYKRTAFFSGTPKFFGPSYFEAALVPKSILSAIVQEK